MSSCPPDWAHCEMGVFETRVMVASEIKKNNSYAPPDHCAIRACGHTVEWNVYYTKIVWVFLQPNQTIFVTMTKTQLVMCSEQYLGK